MKQTDIDVKVALERMWIYFRVSVREREDLSHTLMSGHPITYTAYDTFGAPIGHTVVTPQDFPVTLVTEEAY